jgi:hypothetical protein
MDPIGDEEEDEGPDPRVGEAKGAEKRRYQGHAGS